MPCLKGYHMIPVHDLLSEKYRRNTPTGETNCDPSHLADTHCHPDPGVSRWVPGFVVSRPPSLAAREDRANSGRPAKRRKSQQCGNLLGRPAGNHYSDSQLGASWNLFERFTSKAQGFPTIFPRYIYVILSRRNLQHSVVRLHAIIDSSEIS